MKTTLMQLSESIYGSTVCPNCGKTHYAVLATSHNVIPPPNITVGCQCQTPPLSLNLYYSSSKNDL
jgi:hypothetical protein